MVRVYEKRSTLPSHKAQNGRHIVDDSSFIIDGGLSNTTIKPLFPDAEKPLITKRKLQ